MGKAALEGFLIRLAVDPALARRWADAQVAAELGDDQRMTILNEDQFLEDRDKQAILAGSNEIGKVVFSSQHTVSASGVKITLTVEPQ